MLFHYTDKKGHDGIRSQLDWVFKAHRQRRNDLPKGAYFTTLEPTEENLSLICRKLQIPLRKREFVFQFASVGDLKPLNLRDYILFSADDYIVSQASGRQRGHGPSEDCVGQRGT